MSMSMYDHTTKAIAILATEAPLTKVANNNYDYDLPVSDISYACMHASPDRAHGARVLSTA